MHAICVKISPTHTQKSKFKFSTYSTKLWQIAEHKRLTKKLLVNWLLYTANQLG